jgi:hypothetical protein
MELWQMDVVGGVNLEDSTKAHDAGDDEPHSILSEGTSWRVGSPVLWALVQATVALRSVSWRGKAPARGGW